MSAKSPLARKGLYWHYTHTHSDPAFPSLNRERTKGGPITCAKLARARSCRNPTVYSRRQRALPPHFKPRLPTAHFNYTRFNTGTTYTTPQTYSPSISTPAKMTSRIPTTNAPRLSTAPSSIKPRQLVPSPSPACPQNLPYTHHFSIFRKTKR